MRSLPIDPLLPELVATLKSRRTLVLEAEPGAGKTTRVPAALLEVVPENELIVVAEPRRLPARLAAAFVASERGETVGRTVGYAVRFDRAMSDATRILYVTEGILLRQLLDDPELKNVGAVVLDEFHERHLTTDLLLSLIERLKRGSRPDLLLVTMSATLEAERLATHLDAPRLRSEGRVFPLSIEHVPRADERPLERQVASAVKRLLDEEPEGDVLVFLPGAREIRLCAIALEGCAALVLPLHGDLPIAEQARAVEKSTRRRVILSTNVAESSVTIEGVTAVVDSGLARVAGHSSWTGMPTLATAKISRASATQRAGRAARTRPGRAVRLYTSGDLATRPEHDKPEILREDLAEAALGLHGVGVEKLGELRFLDAPPDHALAAAETLLTRLGAVDASSRLTDLGRRMLLFPVSPRLARVIVEGERRGVAELACLAAALLSERDIRTDARAALGKNRPGRKPDSGSSSPSDVLELVERFAEARDARFDARRLEYMQLDARTATAVERASEQLGRLARDDVDRPGTADAVDRALLLSLLAGFPDRLARRRTRGDGALILFSGKAARLADTSVVTDAAFMVALDAEDAAGRGVIVRLASAVEPDWVLELHPELVEMNDELAWNASSEQVDRVSKISAGSVVLEEERRAAPPSPEASETLLAAALASGRFVTADDAARALVARVAFVRMHVPEAALPELGEDAVHAALARACQGRTRFEELEALDLGAELSAALDMKQRSALAKEAPTRLTLPGGKVTEVHYDPGKPPWIESRLQDFFGMESTPTVARGRVPLTVHLLAPNQRAVQVTTDLAGFWERHYPGIRRELCRRYPRHSWPENGATATPPAPRRK